MFGSSKLIITICFLYEVKFENGSIDEQEELTREEWIKIDQIELQHSKYFKFYLDFHLLPPNKNNFQISITINAS